MGQSDSTNYFPEFIREIILYKHVYLINANYVNILSL